MLADLDHFQYDNSTVKVDWALREPIPWSDPAVREAGTVHVVESLDLLTEASVDLERQLSRRGRSWCSASTPRRMPHARRAVPIPPGRTPMCRSTRAATRAANSPAAGRARARPVRRSSAATPTLVGGAINGGTAKLYQQLIFRPVPGLGRSETPVRSLYLGSASAHPGGGVHGAPGANAARALLAHRRLSPTRPLRR